MARRPQVICHMLSGIDARVDVDHWCPTEGASRDAQVALYFELMKQFNARAHIVGRVTMEPYAKGIAADPGGPAPAHRMHQGLHRDLPLAVVLDPEGKLHWQSDALDGDHLLMVLGPDVPDGHLRELAGRGVSYLVALDARIDPTWLLDQLARHFGASRVLVAGGGLVNGRFLAAGLVDEISLLMVPGLDGRRAARNLFDTGELGLAGRMALSLQGAEVLDHQAVHLRYAVSRDSAAR